MMKALVIIVVCVFSLLVLSSVGTYAQEHFDSPALDPDYAILSPKQSFFGYYANTGTGYVKSMGPFLPSDEYNSIFLWSIDTLGYGNIEFVRPAGLFKGGPNFSLFNKSIFSLKGLYDPSFVFYRGRGSIPLILEGAAPLRVFLPQASGYFNDSSYSTLTSKTVQANGFHYYFSRDRGYWKSSYLDDDSLQDVIAIRSQVDSTLISVWYAADSFNKGVKDPDGGKVIPASADFKVPTAFNGRLQDRLVQIGDIDLDGIPDLLFLADSNDRSNNSGPFGPQDLTLVFGARSEGGKWKVDTTLELHLSDSVRNFTFMDFLYSDNKPDLLLLGTDTIFCFAGRSGFLRHGFNLSDATLKIPSPAKLDKANFNRNGEGGLTDWGESLWDAGNINGTGQHSLATSALYYPFTGSLYVIAYFFVYSGGDAADEKADAIYADNSTHYVGFDSFDTVKTSSNGQVGFLLGDEGYTIGSQGRLDYFGPTENIPHKPDPRWTSSVVWRKLESSNLSIQLRSNPFKNRTWATINGGITSNANLIVRDLLGRVVWSRSLPLTSGGKNEVLIDLYGQSAGVYFLELSEQHESVSARLILLP